MPTIQTLAEAALYVDHLARARDFYTAVLGLPVTADFGEACFLQTGPNSTLILFDRAALATRQSVIPGHGATGPTHIALAISPDELDAWRQRLLTQGVEIEHEQTWSQGTRSLYFRDPDNNSIELIDGTHYPAIWAQQNLAEARKET